MNDYKELVKYLREEADAVQSIAIEFNIPISAENHSREAADAIEQLAMDINVLTKERDAFMDDFMRGFKNQIEEDHGIYRCDICKHLDRTSNMCRISPLVCNGFSKWQWRGVQEANNGT